MEDPCSGTGSGSGSSNDSEECMIETWCACYSASNSVTPRPKSLLDVLKPSTLARKEKEKENTLHATKNCL